MPHYIEPKKPKVGGAPVPWEQWGWCGKVGFKDTRAKNPRGILPENAKNIHTNKWPNMYGFQDIKKVTPVVRPVVTWMMIAGMVRI